MKYIKLDMSRLTPEQETRLLSMVEKLETIATAQAVCDGLLTRAEQRMQALAAARCTQAADAAREEAAVIREAAAIGANESKAKLDELLNFLKEIQA